MSFYKWPNFGAVMNRFSILKKIKRKTPFFYRFSFFNTGAYGKNVFFLNQYFHYILAHRNLSLGFI
jgi:hypothetical protein